MKTVFEHSRLRLYGALVVLNAAAPFHLYNGYNGPLSDKRFAFAAAGLLVGCLFHRIFQDRRGAAVVISRQHAIALDCMAILCFMVTAGLEYADFPFYLAGDVESTAVAFLPPSLFSAFSHFILYIEPTLAAASGALSMFGFLLALEKTAEQVDVDRQERKGLRESTAHLLAAPFVFFLVGLSSRSLWSLFAIPVADGPGLIASVLSGVLVLLFSALIQLASLAVAARMLAYLDERNAGNRYDRSSYVRSLLLCFCAGQIVCWFSVRFAYGVASNALLAIALFSIAVAGLLWVMTRLSNRLPQKEAVEAAAEKLTAIVKDRWGLSPRESEFTALTLLGKSSAEIAHQCGVASSTVRATMYRAHQKLGLSTEREVRKAALKEPDMARFLQTYGDIDAVAVTFENEEVSSHHGSLLSCALAAMRNVLLAYAFLCTLVPVHAAGQEWGFGSLPVVGVSIGLFGLALAYLLRDSVRRLNVDAVIGGLRGRTDVWGRAAHIVATLLLVVALFICARDLYGGASMRSSTGSIVFVIASYGYVACSAVLFARGVGNRFNRMMIAQAGCALVLWGVGLQSEGAWLVILAVNVSAVLTLLLLIGKKKETVFLGRSERDDTAHPALPDLALAALLGFCFEELWRSLGQESFTDTSVFLFLSVFVSAWRCVSWGQNARGKRRLLLAVALGSASIALVTREVDACALLASCCCMCVLLRQDLLKAPIHYACLVAAAVGLASIIGVNKLQDAAAAMPAVAFDAFGTSSGLVAAARTCFVLAYSCAGVLAWRIALRFREERLVKACAKLAEGNAALQRRRRAVLVAGGLSDIQVTIMLSVASGVPLQAIADRVGYAPATVKSLQMASYRQLSIHSKAELIFLLSQVNTV